MADSPQAAHVPTEADVTKGEAEMCCKEDGLTAAEHRHESQDGKCCVDK